MRNILFLLGSVGLVMLVGCAMVTITVDLDNPYPVTMIWNGEELAPDPGTDELPAQILEEGGAVVESLVKDACGKPIKPDSCEWYLNDALLKREVLTRCSSSSKVVIEDNLGYGTYQLSLIAQKDKILSSVRLQIIVPE
jgi:hypothetical protein